MENKRVIESETLQVKLLNGSVISIRPLTLAERKECLSIVPKDLDKKDPEKFVNTYIDLQGDLLFFVISRSNDKFKRSDIDTLLDTSLIEKIIKFTLKDPFTDMLQL